MLRVDQVHAIRHQVLVQGRSRRVVAREMGVSRNTVRRYVEELTEPVRRESEPRPRPVFEEVRPRLDELLEEWSGRTTPKQRLTGTLLHGQLLQEGLRVGITVVRGYLRERRRQRAETFIPLVHRAGDEAQVDFFEVVVEIDGERRKGWMFVMRLMYSGRDFAWLYERCDQVSFLDGHVRAFGHLGAVPARCIYDNLTLAVSKVVMPHRELTDRFEALANHYSFEPCFARPGEGHDKGGVESRGKGIRLQHLTPIPRGDSLQQVNETLLGRLDASQPTRRDREGRNVADRFAEELPRMRALPGTDFEARKAVPVSVRRTAVVQVEGAWYSVPSTWKRLDAMVFVGPSEVTIVCRGESVTRPRQRFGGRCVRYRDYLPELARKPQAVRQVAPELVAELGEPFGRLWELLVESHGGREAGRVMARVVGALHDHGEDPVRRAVLAALEAGRADLLALTAVLAPARVQRVPVPDSLAGHEIEVARAADYDALLVGAEA